MGTFAVNVHVRTPDVAAVGSVLDRFEGESVCKDPDGGWVTVYDRSASRQDSARIAALVTGLSAGTGTTVVAFLVHDSDMMQCWVAESGEIRTHVDSWPGFPDEDPVPSIEHPRALLQLSGLGLDELETLLAQDVVFIDDVVTELAGHLGIPAERALGDFNHRDETVSGVDDSAGGEAPTVDDGIAVAMGELQRQLGSGEIEAPRADELVAAAAAGDLETIRSLLATGVPVDARAPWAPASADNPSAVARSFTIPATPLYVAASRNHPELIRLLVTEGADPDLGVLHGSTALAAAAGAGHLDAVEALLTAGAQPDAADVAGTTPTKVVALTRQHLEGVRSLGTAFLDKLPMPIPDDDDLVACAEAIARAIEARG